MTEFAYNILVFYMIAIQAADTDPSGDYILVQFGYLLSLERWIPNSHFEQQHSQRPPVHGETVALPTYISVHHLSSYRQCTVMGSCTSENLYSTARYVNK